MDAVVDTLLPGCLPHSLASCAAQLFHRTNIMYDTLSFSFNDNTTAATCCLHSIPPSSLLNWPVVYTDDSSIDTIVKALQQYKSTSIPMDII